MNEELMTFLDALEIHKLVIGAEGLVMDGLNQQMRQFSDQLRRFGKHDLLRHRTWKSGYCYQTLSNESQAKNPKGGLQLLQTMEDFLSKKCESNAPTAADQAFKLAEWFYKNWNVMGGKLGGPVMVQST